MAFKRVWRASNKVFAYCENIALPSSSNFLSPKQLSLWCVCVCVCVGGGGVHVWVGGACVGGWGVGGA